MNVVEPIRDLAKFQSMLDTLKQQESQRDFIMVLFGCYTGLRISDILTLKVKDVRNKSGIDIIQQKTQKKSYIVLQEDLKEELRTYCIDRNDDEYLFKSTKNPKEPISRVRAWQIIHKLGESFGIEKLGTHTLRKTFGYHYYKQTKDIATLMNMFGHSTEAITLRYIGVQQDTINNARMSFSIWQR